MCSRTSFTGSATFSHHRSTRESYDSGAASSRFAWAGNDQMRTGARTASQWRNQARSSRAGSRRCRAELRRTDSTSARESRLLARARREARRVGEVRAMEGTGANPVGRRREKQQGVRSTLGRGVPDDEEVEHRARSSAATSRRAAAQRGPVRRARESVSQGRSLVPDCDAARRRGRAASGSDQCQRSEPRRPARQLQRFVPRHDARRRALSVWTIAR